MDRMRINTPDRKAELPLSAEETRMLLAIIDAGERREINAPEPANRRIRVIFKLRKPGLCCE